MFEILQPRECWRRFKCLIKIVLFLPFGRNDFYSSRKSFDGKDGKSGFFNVNANPALFVFSTFFIRLKEFFETIV